MGTAGAGIIGCNLILLVLMPEAIILAPDKGKDFHVIVPFILE
jgi:hypothetical protein